jgi:hypothetical protein
VESIDDDSAVGVPLLHVRMTGSQVGRDEQSLVVSSQTPLQLQPATEACYRPNMLQMSDFSMYVDEDSKCCSFYVVEDYCS